MIIHNVRAGFATNSSSSHSIVILPTDKIGFFSENTNDDMNFGWSDFVLTNPESKLEYLAAQLFMNLYNEISDEFARAKVVYDLTGIDLSEFTYTPKYGNSEPTIDAGIDHQSVWNLNGFNISDPDVRCFIDDLREYITKDEVVILGGNDNGYFEPELPDRADRPEIFTEILDNSYYHTDRVLRKDGHYYTIFSKRSGMKVRISLKDNIPPYEKSSTPELVDLKITQFCPFGCEFCYQSSTKEGLHAPLGKIKEYVDYLAELKVMEIAIGGGEPTMHPDFIEIIKYIHEKGIIANFTTYSVAWLKKNDIVQAVRNYISAIGVSVHSIADISKVEKIHQTINETDSFSVYRSSEDSVRVMAQHVFGSINPGETTQLLIQVWDKAIPLLLLGYKSVGFGSNIEPHDMESVIGLIKLAAGDKRYYGPKLEFLAVDTAFVDKFSEVLEGIGVSSKLMSSPEGKFSMYIDAVDSIMAPSSYCSKEDYSPVPKSSLEIKDMFSKY